MSAEAMIRIDKLTKQFDYRDVLKEVSLEIRPGRIIGLLGANGGGKSTLLRHMVGLYLPHEGTCATFGTDAGRLSAETLARIGYVHQEGALVDWMAVPQLIRYVAAYYPNWNEKLEKEFIKRFEVPLHSRVGALSPGQRQKLAILLAIGFEPELLILDEPAAALDPVARHQFLELLLEIIQDPNRAIIISSHILSDVEKVIDHVLIMDKGKLLRDCSFDALLEEFMRVRLTSLNGPLPEDLPFAAPIACERTDTEAVVTMNRVSREDLDSAAERLNCEVETLTLSFEEIYRIVVKGER